MKTQIIYVLALVITQVLAKPSTSQKPTTPAQKPTAPTQKPTSKTTPASQKSTPEPTDDHCREFLVDECITSANNPQVELIHGVSIESCQFFCNTVYSHNCTFFIKDNKQDVCEIWSLPESEYETSCVKKEGPKLPAKGDSTCEKAKDDCVGFKQGYCLFEGNLLDHLNSITSETTCQMACQHVPSCQYYIYDTHTSDCMLLDSSSRQCDILRGSKDSPNYNTCI